MTASLEMHRPQIHTSKGDVALEITNKHRGSVDEHFRVDVLGNEFPRLDQKLGGVGLYLARAGDNEAGAFKWRGALVGAVALQALGAETLLVPSAGNHARGAILAAKILDMNINVVVPKTAPPAKKEGLRKLGDGLRLQIYPIGTSFNESLDYANNHPELGELLHPFDDPYVMAGQGTLVDNMLAAQDDIKHIVAPVGGGGLVSGMLQRLQELDRSDVTMHAIEAKGSNSLSMSLASHTLTAVERPHARYGGSAVQQIGKRAFEVCGQYKNLHVLQVSDEEVNVVTEDYEQDRLDLDRADTPAYEPTSLVAIAALQSVAKQHPHETIVVVGTGHNDSLWPMGSPGHYATAIIGNKKDNDLARIS